MERCVYEYYARRGLHFHHCESEWDQIHIGENLEGVEIKACRNWRRTGNYFIEIGERAKPRTPEEVEQGRREEHTPSGIYKRDNQHFYLVGDPMEWAIFPTHVLVAEHERNVWRVYQDETKQGYLLRRSYALEAQLLHALVQVARSEAAEITRLVRAELFRKHLRDLDRAGLLTPAD